MILTGDTVRLKASFYGYDGELSDPDTVAVTIYSHIGQAVLTQGVAVKKDVGVYYYDYTIPSDVKGALVYEFSGTMDGLPTVGRAMLEKSWV